MTRHAIELTREQVLAHRQAVGALDTRLPAGADALRRAAWAGLQDSMPRAALLSIHARVEATGPSTWEDPSLVQVWGPRFSAFVVAAEDRAVFTLGRLPDPGERRRYAEAMADRVEAFLDGRRMTYSDAGHALGIPPNAIRYAAPTGRLLLRWDGARQPVIWAVPAPEMDPVDARLELARRHLRVFGPTTAEGFGAWAGIVAARARATFDALDAELLPVRTPAGAAWILAADEARLRAAPPPPAAARLLPSGDTYTLLQGADRELLVPEADRRSTLWTPRVWPGGLLVGGEVAGTWQRSNANVTIRPWRRLTSPQRAAVEAEAASLPIPGVEGRLTIAWHDDSA
jgi:hypothetical protein